MQSDPSDMRHVIDTRTLAVVVGCLSLAFGIWAATGAPSEVGLAAGALGLVAGLMTLVPRPDDTHGDAGGEQAGVPEGAVETTPGFFDRDREPTHSAHAATRSESDRGGDEAAPLAPARRAAGANDEGSGRSNADVPSADVQGTDDPEMAVAATPLTDPVTGLFSEDYLMVALEGRLASARRHLRPVALAVLQVCQGLPDSGSLAAAPDVVATAITDTVRDSDIACRLGDGTFGVILEDTPENGAVWTVERIRRNLVSTNGHHTLWAGVACYPAHGFDVTELMTQVRVALEAAKQWNQDRIEVAIAE